jgi:hypothetical protein
MRYGDIVYFRFNSEVRVQQEKSPTNPVDWSRERFSGLLIGDGLSNDRLICIKKKTMAEETVSKCLFRIEWPKKYVYKEQFLLHKTEIMMNQGNLSEKLQKVLGKYQEEEEDYQNLQRQNLGNPVCYGQNFILRHIYSYCYITLNVDNLARQIGSIQMALTEEDNEYSNMRILPSSKVKKVGDVVNYSDSILICCAKDSHYYIHACEYFNYNEPGLEINGSELVTEWKPK